MSFTKVAPEDISKAIRNIGLITSLYNNVKGYEWDIEIWGDVTEVPTE